MYIYHCCISVRRRGCWHFSKSWRPPKSLISPSSGELSPLQCRAAASDESLSVVLLTNLSSPIITFWATTPESTLTFFFLFFSVPTVFFSPSLRPELRRNARQDSFFSFSFFKGGRKRSKTRGARHSPPLLFSLFLFFLFFFFLVHRDESRRTLVITDNPELRL